MISLPLTIACVVVVIPIRSALCGDPLLWASVEAQAEYKTKPGGGPGGECSLPSTFQMRADGVWLPSSEFDLTGNFDEDCAIYLHLTIPEGESGGGEEPSFKIKELDKEKEGLKEKENMLSKETKEHDTKMETLRNEKERLDAAKKKLKETGEEKNALDKKSDYVIEKRNSLKEKIKTLGISDLDSAIKEAEEKEKQLTKDIADANTKKIFLDEILYGICSKIPTTLYLSIVGTSEVSRDAEVYICHESGPNYSEIIEEMWSSETAKMEKKVKEFKDDIDTIKSKELELDNEKRAHVGKLTDLEKERNALQEKKTELTTIQNRLESQQARKRDVDAKRWEVEGKKKKLGEYQDENFLKGKEKELTEELRKTKENEKRYKRLLHIHQNKDCDEISDLEFMEIRDEIKANKKDIQVCGMQYDDDSRIIFRD